jgi:hypothetical protein
MASKYIQKFPIPDGFPEILHDLSKEILRNQPEDIIEFSYLYFKCLQEGTVLDYPRKGKNIPCDFKTGVPKISERDKKKSNRDIEAHTAAIESSHKLNENKLDTEPAAIQESNIDAYQVDHAHPSSNRNLPVFEENKVTDDYESRGTYKQQMSVEMKVYLICNC